MKRFRTFGFAAAICACLPIASPQLTYAATPATPHVAEQSLSTPKDVALGAGGSLRGQVVNGQGNPVAGTRVVLVKDSQLVSMVETDRNGQFTASNLTGGVYQIATQEGVGVYRLWAANTAPPAAEQSALLVADGQVVRGQGGQLLSFLANPWVLAGLVAAAIAIPLALDDDDAS